MWWGGFFFQRKVTMQELLQRTCGATGLTDRQVIQQAYFDFTGENDRPAMDTANRFYDEYVGTNRLPGWVKVYCDKRLAQTQQPRILATRRVRTASRIGPTDHLVGVSGVDDLFDRDVA